MTGLQSIFRGHMIRQSTDKDVTAVRQRLRELSANRNERDTLEHRTEQALAIVATTAHLDKIIPAIGTLGASLPVHCKPGYTDTLQSVLH